MTSAKRIHDTKTSKLPFIISVSILAVLGLCYWLIPSFQQSVKEAYTLITSEDQQRIREWVKQFGLGEQLQHLLDNPRRSAHPLATLPHVPRL